MSLPSSSSSSSSSRSSSCTSSSPKLSPPPPQQVQHITRQVIRRLERSLGGQQHIDMPVDVVNFSATSTPDDDTSDFASSNVSDGECEYEKPSLWEEYQGFDEDKRHDSHRGNDALDGTALHFELNANGKVKEIHKQKIDWEIPRKLLHSSIGFFTLYLYITESDVSKIVVGLWSSLCIIIPAEIIRFRSPKFEWLYERVLGRFMRESEKNSTNGVIWYILGVNFVLQFYPRDVATVAILILSWADTAASTIGRLYGPSSPRLPSHFKLPHPSLPIIQLPLAKRKSWAGFGAACVTGALIAFGFWGWIGPARFGGRDLSWDFVKGIRGTVCECACAVGNTDEGAGVGGNSLAGWMGLGVLSVVAGLISGVAEALDLGSMDDNLTLPIISGGCILGFLKFVGSIGLSSST